MPVHEMTDLCLVTFADKNKMFGPLTFTHSIPTFNDPESAGLSKHRRERRKGSLTTLSPFPHYACFQEQIIIFATINLLSASAFNFDQFNPDDKL